VNYLDRFLSYFDPKTNSLVKEVENGYHSSTSSSSATTSGHHTNIHSNSYINYSSISESKSHSAEAQDDFDCFSNHNLLNFSHVLMLRAQEQKIEDIENKEI
jgi:hypothetical protein